MAKSAYQKQLEANQKGDALYAKYAAQGTLLSTRPANPNKPAVATQANEVRSRLAERYNKVGAGQPVKIGPSTNPQQAYKTGKVYESTGPVRNQQGPSTGMRGGTPSIVARAASSYSNTAAAVRSPNAASVNRPDQNVARAAVGGVKATSTNGSTIFQEGLRARLAKK